MYNYDKKFYAILSEKTAFQRDILEKVHRLTIILDYINSHPRLEKMLVLKGGTAIPKYSPNYKINILSKSSY